ncbi:MAG: PQQ-binding-like beta-propeller repeat protein [Deltaproteobacteria bacterium]|nr:PQQ-binding-like beta-propeller repeat protein [Deltaproteobacteria bacterium]
MSISHRMAGTIFSVLFGVLSIVPGCTGRDGGSAIPASQLWVSPVGSMLSAAADEGALYLGGSFTDVGYPLGFGIILARDLSGSGMETLAPGIDPKSFPRANNWVWCSVADGRGGFYIGGDFDKIDGYTRKYLAHVLKEGRLDTGFDFELDGEVTFMTLVGDVLYLGGRFKEVNGEPRDSLAAINIKTNEVIEWHPDLWGAEENHAWVDWLAGDDKAVYISFDSSSNGGGLAAVDRVTGEVKWNDELKGRVFAVAIKGRDLYVSGGFGSIDGNAGGSLACLDADTGELKGLDIGSTDGEVFALAVLGDRLYAGGIFTMFGGYARNNLAAVDLGGDKPEVSMDWNPNADGYVYTLTVDGQSNTVFATGTFRELGGSARNEVAAIDSDTGKVKDWDPRINSATTISVGSEGLFVGGMTAIGCVERHNVAALDLETGEPTDLDPKISNPLNTGVVNKVAIKDGILFIAGLFDKAVGTDVGGFAAVNVKTGELVWSLGPDEAEYVEDFCVLDDSVVVDGLLGPPNSRENSIVKLDIDSGEMKILNGGMTKVETMAAANDILYMGGSFEQLFGKARQNIAAMDLETGKLIEWSPKTEKGVKDIAVSGDTLFASGTFDMGGGKVAHGLAAIDRHDDSKFLWGKDIRGEIRTMTVRDGVLYVGGNFSFIGEDKRTNLAALDAATGKVLEWRVDVPTWYSRGSQEPMDAIFDLTTNSKSLFITGIFGSVGDKFRLGLAQVDLATGAVR